MRRSGNGARRPLVLATGTILSLGIHGFVFGAFLYPVEQKPGAIEQPTEAVSLETMRSEVLEAVSPSQSTETLAARPIDVQSGESADSAMAEAAKPKDARVAAAIVDEAPSLVTPDDVAAGPEALDVLDGALESNQSRAAETDPIARDAETKPSAKRQRQKPPERAQEAPAKKPTSHANRQKSAEAKQNGGVSARSNSGQKQSGGRISASSGSTRNYAALVRARVASRRPGGSAGRGTVVVAFSVSRSGALSSARVSRSSGNPGLDNSVLAAVRSAGPFPQPPPGANLSFAMPFYFK